MLDSKKSGTHKLLSRMTKKDVRGRLPLGAFRIRTSQEETADIRKIKSAIPLIKNLHPSWNCPDNIGWQILRLNKEYREHIFKFYHRHYMPTDSFVFPGSGNILLQTDFPPLPQESFQDYERRVTDWAEDMIVSQVGMFRGLKIDKNDLIPSTIRFPHPFIRPLLPLHKFHALTIRRGHPQNWLENLLIYELSRAGVKNAEIGRLILGMEKSRPSIS